MKRWLLWPLLGLGGLYLVTCLFAALIPLSRYEELIESALPPSPAWRVEVGRVRLSLWTGPSAEVRDLALYRRGSGSSFEVLRIDRIRLTWPLVWALQGRRALRVRIVGPRILVAYAFEGTSAKGGEMSAAAAEAITRQVLAAPTGETLRSLARALKEMVGRVLGFAAGEGAEYRIDAVELEEGSVRISAPTLLGGEAVPVALDQIRALFSVPREGAPGALALEARLQVGAEQRQILLSGTAEREGGEDPGTQRLVLSDLIVRIGQVAMTSGVQVTFPISPGPGPPGETKRIDLLVRVEEGLEGLSPLWVPLVEPGLRWKLQGGADLHYWQEREGAVRRAGLELDLNKTGILLGGIFHKPVGVSAGAEVHIERRGSGLRVAPSKLSLGPLRVACAGARAPGAGTAGPLALSCSARATDLSALARLLPGQRLAPRQPSGVMAQARLRLEGAPEPKAEWFVDELSFYSGDSDVHLSGQAVLAAKSHARFLVQADRLVPRDWLGEGQGPALLGALAPLLRVPLDGVRAEVQIAPQSIEIGHLSARWGGGQALGAGTYNRERCRGEGSLELRSASLEALARAMGGEDVAPELREATLSLQGEVGRDLPCTAGSPAALEAWGANLTFSLAGLDLPIVSSIGETGGAGLRHAEAGAPAGDLSLLESLTGARLRPIPRIKSGTGVLRWQGSRARLEAFDLDAGAVRAHFSGELGSAAEGPDLTGELSAPRATLSQPPLLAEILVEGDRVRLPLRIGGSWARPRISLSFEPELLREMLMQMKTQSSENPLGVP